MRFVNVLLRFVRKIRLAKRIARESLSEERAGMKDVPVTFRVALTEEEQRTVVAFWGKDIAKSFKEFEVYKYARGFDVRFMPFAYYLPLISRRLNSYQYAALLEDKSLLGYLMPGIIRFPKVYLRTVAGEYYNENMQFLSEEKAKQVVKGLAEFCIKPASGGFGGLGVKKYFSKEYNHAEWSNVIDEIFNNYKKNFVVQEVLTEHESLEKFNPTSVNTLRVQSLYLNGRVTVHSILLRIGGIGAEVDNICSGGVVVGVHHDGRLFDVGFDAKMNQYTSYGNITFKGECLPQIPSLIQLIKDAHVKQFPIVKYIGWDIMFDRQNTPVCIEVNACQNGVLCFQIASGPTFGDRTQEVLDYCKTREFSY